MVSNLANMNETFRIGIMGSAGSGKTTLACWLSSTLGIGLIEEGVREWLAPQELKKLNELSWQRQLELQEHYLAAKIRNESLHKTFVSDRTTLDAVITLLLRRSRIDARILLPKDFVRRAIKHASDTYDKIVLLQWRGKPRVIADGVREVEIARLEREYELCAALCELIDLRTVLVNAHPTQTDTDLLVHEILKA
jgi:nicotinamide riboside kinase